MAPKAGILHHRLTRANSSPLEKALHDVMATRANCSRPVVLLVRGMGPSARMFLVFVPSLCGFDHVCFVRCENCLLGHFYSPFYFSNTP